MADSLLEPNDGLRGARAVVGGLRVILDVTGTVIDRSGAEKDEGVDRAGNEGEEVGVGEGVDIVEAKGRGDAEGGG